MPRLSKRCFRGIFFSAGFHQVLTGDDMIETLRRDPYRIGDERVLNALRRVDRKQFVPESWRHAAYEDRALPIGHEQTISQPYMVALMTELLNVHPEHRILEIGTGSGYQTAVLAELAGHVYSAEVVGTLAKGARETLERLGYRNVSIKHDDGIEAWLEKAPFDGIILTCAPAVLPETLRLQLAKNGTLVYPAGDAERQHLFVQRRRGDQWQFEKKIPVRFVPLTVHVR